MLRFSFQQSPLNSINFKLFRGIKLSFSLEILRKENRTLVTDIESRFAYNYTTDATAPGDDSRIEIKQFYNL